uniref:DUF2894 domain-containing protein n=1 Tax=Escherichia coli TaxID=562 RepID=UPI00227E2BBB
GEDPDAIAAQARRDAYPDLPALDGLREIWSGLSADRQVRQSQEQVHKNAGPLNSNQLVHRALSLMRELSPGLWCGVAGYGFMERPNVPQLLQHVEAQRSGL